MGFHHSQRPDRWRGFVIGLAGGLAGTVVMGGYWKLETALHGSDPRALTTGEGPHPLDDISLIGTHHEAEESSTAAIGRIAYTQIAGKPPKTEETKTLLSYLVHYGYGAFQGGLYGAATGGRGARDITDGLAYGSALWLFGDELLVSLLGIAAGPGSAPPTQHAHRWAAHVVYGLTTSSVTTLLRRMG
jgi:hypothetical protein